MLELTPVFILLVIFGFLYGVIYLNIRRKERMAMLDRGADPTLFQEPHREKIHSLRYGLFLIGIALGIFLGNILEEFTRLEPEVSYFSMIFLFGGIALVISHFMGKSMEKKD